MPSLAAELRSHIPLLRRYARSLTGEQENGDALVGQVLEQLASSTTPFPRDLDPRVALYRVFARKWLATSQAPNGNDEGHSLIDRRIATLTPLPRQAFLLVAVEGFSADEAAAILERSREELETYLDEAGREIAAQVATDVLIIEDEPLIAFDLRNVVTSIGHRVVDIARTRGEATAAVARHRPGLILADVQLADGSSGLDAVREILGGLSVPVIFITAFPEQVLTGTRPEPTFLIPKPFRPEMIKTIVSQALFFAVKAHNVKTA